MADIKITDLPAYTDPVSTDVLPIVDVGGDLTKKVSIADLLENAGTGSAAAPSFSFDGDNAGIYRPGANQVAITTGGIQRLQVDGPGNMFLGGTLPSAPAISLNADGSANFNNYVQAKAGFIAKQDTGYYFIGQSTSNVNTFLVENSGNVKIGGTLPSSPNITLNADGTGKFAGDVQIGDNSTGTKIFTGSTIRTYASGSIVTSQSNTIALGIHPSSSAPSRAWGGFIKLTGRDRVQDTPGTDNPSVIIDGGRATAGASDGNIWFYTNKGGNTGTPKAMIEAAGSLLIGGTLPSAPNISLNSAGSAQFSGSVSIGGTAAANTIDEYEEGTWTPALNWTNVTYTTQQGKYTKIGNRVFFSINLIWTANDASSATTISLPFASVSANERATISVQDVALPANFQYPTADIFSSTIYVRYVTTSGAYDTTYGVVANDAGSIAITGNYSVP